jgi:hypothetical protein
MEDDPRVSHALKFFGDHEYTLTYSRTHWSIGVKIVGEVL